MKTPQIPYPKLAASLGAPEIYLKREDLHSYGSHKGRSIPLMIKTYLKEGHRDFTISSSGNAALAAIHTITQHNKNNPQNKIRLAVFVGQNIPDEKLKKLTENANHNAAGGRRTKYITIHKVPKPRQMAFQIEKKRGFKLIKQSTDDIALEGYQTLAEELNKIQGICAVFIPTSSGTTAQALGKFFINLENNPAIHITQTAACHPIAKAFSAYPQAKRNKTSIASAIVDRVALRKNAVIKAVKNSKGSGWIVNDDEIKEAIKLVKKTTGIEISPNSALSVAGLKKAVENGNKFSGPVACLITGD